MRTIVLNRSNLINDGDNNKLVYQFPGSVSFTNSYLALSQASLYYSWFNIAAQYNNNTIQYTWTNLAVTTTFTVTIPDGLYEVSKLNEFLQFSFIANGHYLVNTAGENVYYAELIVNPSRYAVQINTFLFPVALPALWTNPAAIVFPTQTFNPEIILPARINEILGYIVNFTTDNNVNNAFVPPAGDDKVAKLANGTISYISTTSPDLQPNSSLLVSVSNIDNKYSQPSSIIYSIVPTVSIGGLISEKVPNFAWNRLIPGTYNNLRLTLLGTNLQPIKINDPAMTFILVIKDDDGSN